MPELSVFRNDAVTVQGIRDAAPDGIVISPGPGTPDDAGVSLDLIELHQEIPIFGVCLGHQSIGQAFGGKVISAPTLMHGKTSQVQHQSENVFAKLPNPFRAMRYHSLAVERESLPDCLHITAETPEGVIMGFTHKEFPVYGVQFHPESFLTEGGKQILSNFLALTANRV
ncbi:MAG: aminodeoxychorismate/anthranilate synthase component II [Calditrichia bacterium]